MGYVASLFRMEEHREALAHLWRENMSDTTIGRLIGERMDWLYAKSPLGPTQTWLAVDEESKAVVGCASAYPHDVAVRGEVMKAGIAMDLAIDKAHRSAGPAVVVERAITKEHRGHGMAFVYSYPNKGSLAVVKRVGYHVVCEAEHWVKPVRTGYKLGAYIKQPLLMKAASLLGDRALAAADLRHVVRGARRFRTSFTGAADERFDELWQRARGRYTVVGDKSSSFLNWRYANCPTTQFRFFCLREAKSQRLAGFIVYSVSQNRAFVADLFCQDLDDSLSHLLVRFAARMRQAKLDAVFLAYAGSSAFTRRLKELQFIKRDFSRSLVAFVSKDAPEALRTAVLAKESWVLFDGELDL